MLSLKAGNEEKDDAISCHILFTKYDQLRLERVVGTNRVQRMIQNEKNVFLLS